jgi:hypothetical protein
MTGMDGGGVLRLVLSGLLLLARGGMAEEALGEGTLGMSCLSIEKLETETGGKFKGLFSLEGLVPPSRYNGIVGHMFDRTRHDVNQYNTLQNDDEFAEFVDGDHGYCCILPMLRKWIDDPDDLYKP